ncbi:MAG: hypothetical protein N3E37_01780 [Candidatus Micrarchaeota archaeon]|nr:hypothetical protein [Candidatus Micrarchaeota archaeon]
MIKAKFVKTKDGKFVLVFYSNEKKFNVNENLINDEFYAINFDRNLIVLANKNFINEKELEKELKKDAKIEYSEKSNVQKDDGLLFDNYDKYLAVAQKIINLKREERTLENISKVLNKDEIKLIQEMIDKNLIVTSHGEKNKNLNLMFIDKNLFKEAKKMQSKYNQSKYNNTLDETKENLAHVKSNETMELIKVKGFAVIDSEVQLKEFLSVAEIDIVNENIFGIKNFDGKYYYCTKDYYQRLTKKIYELFEKTKENELSIAELKDALQKEDIIGIKTVVLIMKEKEGDIIEVRRDIFKKV